MMPAATNGCSDQVEDLPASKEDHKKDHHHKHDQVGPLTPSAQGELAVCYGGQFTKALPELPGAILELRLVLQAALRSHLSGPSVKEQFLH